jgi:hypothetical protein
MTIKDTQSQSLNRRKVDSWHGEMGRTNGSYLIISCRLQSVIAICQVRNTLNWNMLFC